MTPRAGDPVGSRIAAHAAAFISAEGPDIHIAMAGSSRYDDDEHQFVPPNFHKSLEELLKRYLPENLGLQFQEDAKQLDELADKLADTEARYTDRQKTFWHSLWYHVGDTKDTLDAWVALIPNEYGLAVVKTGLAVVFKLAEKSAERRQKIERTFVAIREALTRADPAKRSFRSNEGICVSADHLNQSIVECIEDMILLTSKEKTSWRQKLATAPKFRHRTPPPDPDVILGKLEEARKEFERDIDLVRDNVIEGTGLLAQSMAMRLPGMHRNVLETNESLRVLSERQDERDKDYKRGYEAFYSMLHQIRADTQNIVARENNRQNSLGIREQETGQVITRNEVLQILLESKRQRTEIERLRREIRYTRKSRQLIKGDQLLYILTGLPISDSCELADLRQMLQRPNDDLQKCVLYRGKLNTEIQGQVQESVLRNNRVLGWLNRPESDLILVDANIDDPGMPKTTPMSVFCATLVTSMVTAHPEDVVVFHFCGQHSLPKDAWYGPNGLVRLLAIQLLVRLLEMKRCDLGCIDNWDFVEGLENHDLSCLCDLLYHLIAQFSAQTTVYCVVDTISHFDNPRTLSDLKVVMDCFHGIVSDTSLSPAVKILLTNPMHSKRTMKQLPIFQDDPTRLVNLIPNTLTSGVPISDRVVGRTISRQSPTSRYRMRGRYGAEFDSSW
ncbi:hypothetical protein IFM62136_07911 [Aspergillus lentulus]|nr:hypothetical protein IFM62136_07911 [Aspergillus lentulus]